MVSRYPFGKRISMNTKDFGCISEVFLMPGKRFFYIKSLKLRYSLVQEDLAIQHLID